MGKRIRLAVLTALTAALWQGATARATIIASSTISWQQVGPDSYTYSLTLSLDPASTESAYSFWFAWIPGYDLLPSNPTAFTSPPNWTGYNAPDTYGVASGLWSTNTSPLEAGQTLSGFSFTTPDPPSAIIGATSAYLDLPVEESYVYAYPGGRGDFDEIIPAAVVPEPASIATSLLGVPAILLMRRRKRFDLIPA